jgi:hypothetical protein
MKSWKRYAAVMVFVFVFAYLSSPLMATQESLAVLAGKELARVVPPGFYFQGQSAHTQMRNAAAARLGNERYVIAGLVDTSGYSADIRAKYEGFLITDSAVAISGSDLGTGAYGFGFTDNGKMNVFDLAGNEVLSVSSTKDSALKRPRPLMMTKAGNELRLYSGKDYVVIGFK